MWCTYMYVGGWVDDVCILFFASSEFVFIWVMFMCVSMGLTLALKL